MAGAGLGAAAVKGSSGIVSWVKGLLGVKSNNSAGITQSHLTEMAKNGVKFTQENILATTRTPSGQIVFLERGNSSSGLQHIFERHAIDFANKGVSQADISSVVMSAVRQGKIVGVSCSAPVYEVIHNGAKRYINIGIGSNGYIVRANPVSAWKPVR